MSGDLSDVNNSHIFSFFSDFSLASFSQNKTNGRPSSKFTNVKIQRLFQVIVEKSKQANVENGLLKASGAKLPLAAIKIHL